MDPALVGSMKQSKSKEDQINCCKKINKICFWFRDYLHDKTAGIDIDIFKHSINSILTDILSTPEMGNIRYEEDVAMRKVEIGIEGF